MCKLGSMWNKWDLHIHTDASDGRCSCKEILEEASVKGIKCIAVTDHHTVDNIDKMKALAADMNITVISGVEFRTEYGKTSVHMIGLFPDEYNGIKLDADFLRENVLNILGISRSNLIIKGKEVLKRDDLSDDKYFKAGMLRVQVDFKKAADCIHKYGGLVTVHAGSKTNGIDKEMEHEGRGHGNVSIDESLGPLKEELFNQGYIDICDISKSKDSSFYLTTFKKPSITTSDAHERSRVGINPCWIKADLTFNGLRQIIAEPERVSFEYPDILRRIDKNPDKFIKNVVIQRISNASMSELWFDNIQIPLNPGLVAVIGNKGNGKSALADIVSLCANSTNQNWSFLTSSKFRMLKPYDRSKQIEAFVRWYDDSCSITKTLDMPSDISQPERVKYIPQNFFEDLCTNEDENKLEEELKKIIFNYLEPCQRYGYNDLDSIINYLTSESMDSCNELQLNIKKLNAKIIDLESMLDPSYKSKLENELKYKEEQYQNTLLSEPKEVVKPSLKEDPKFMQAKKEVDEFQANCNQFSMTLQSLNNEKNVLIKARQDISASKERLERLYNQIINVKNIEKSLYSNNKLDIDSIINVSYHPDIIQSKINELNERLTKINYQLDRNNIDSIHHRYLESLNQLESSKSKLSSRELEYRKYLKDKHDWDDSLKTIKGSADIEGSIEYFKVRIDYINNKLLDDLNSVVSLRKQYVSELMSTKNKVLEIYKKLFNPIMEFIQNYHNEMKNFPIEFDAVFSIQEFGSRFFDFINQQAAGSYYGKDQGASRLKENIDAVDMFDLNQIVDFPCLINDDLLFDKRNDQKSKKNIEAQLKKGHSKQQLYDFIYGMDYVVPLFQLKMNGKPLSLLSPGERGALLLLLYLFIDVDDKPLILDQPEDNLDNESVFKYLVSFIKTAKQRRQIIMITHNPNLAVVCDADQIIHMKIDKARGNKVSYESGAIENPAINRIIVDILEGTYPAFHNRDSKYFGE